jgi:hypothetical protein
MARVSDADESADAARLMLQLAAETAALPGFGKKKDAIARVLFRF